MAVLDHLRELRRRVIISVLIVAVGAVLGYYLYPHTLAFLRHPYCNVPDKYRLTEDGHSCQLVYTGVLDGFTTRLKVAVISGAVFTAPFWLYQIWAFITPGLRKSERRYTMTFVATSTVLFALGVALAYLVLLRGLPIIAAQSGSGTAQLLTVSSYISFVTLTLVAFGAAFELPLLVVMANFVGVLPAKVLKKSQRIAIFLIFLFAAVATPTTDPFTMCAMAIPMVLLFEGAVVIATVHDRRKARRKALEREEAHLEDDEPSQLDPIPEQLSIGDDSWSDIT